MVYDVNTGDLKKNNQKTTSFFSCSGFCVTIQRSRTPQLLHGVFDDNKVKKQDFDFGTVYIHFGIVYICFSGEW